MIITCYDCPGHHSDDEYLTYRYPCEECAMEWIAKHADTTGHTVTARPERFSDRYVYAV